MGAGPGVIYLFPFYYLFQALLLQPGNENEIKRHPGRWMVQVTLQSSSALIA